MKSNIQNYYKSIGGITNNGNSKFDISIILMNAKTNKTFNKLLTLSIKYNIEIFNNSNGDWLINDTITIINNINNLKKNILKDYTDEILNLEN